MRHCIARDETMCVMDVTDTVVYLTRHCKGVTRECIGCDQTLFDITKYQVQSIHKCLGTYHATFRLFQTVVVIPTSG